MNRRLLLLLLPAVAVALIVAIRTFSQAPTNSGPDTPSLPETAEERNLPDEPDEVVTATEPPAGGVLVLSRDGRPAEADVATGVSEPGKPTPRWRSMGRTGTDGRLLPADFEREPGDQLLAGSPAGIGGPVAWDPTGVVIRLGDGCVVAGHVRDPEGQPVAGVMIGGRRVKREAFSDEDGAFRLIGLMPGHEYRIGALAGGPGRPELTEVTFTEPDEERRIDFEVPAPSGRRLLIDIRFTRPPQAQPELKLDLGSKRPATLDLPLGDTIVACPAPLAPGQEVEVTVSCPGFATARSRVVMPESEESVRITLTLAPGGLPLHGRVVDAEGAPVASAEVFAHATPRLDSDEKWSATTDRAGNFRLRANAAGLHLVALVEAVGASRWLHLSPAAEEVVLVLEDAGVVSGRVLDQDSGAPVEGAKVCLSFEFQGHEHWTVESGPDGSYRFAGVPPGSFVWPWIASTPRANAVEEGPENHRFDAGIQSRTEAVEKGFARVLESFGDTFRRDLPAIRNPGGNCRFVLQFPEGAAPPESVRVKHVSESTRWHRTSEWDVEIDAKAPGVSLWLEQGTHSVHFRAGNRDASVEGIQVSGDGDLPPRTVTFSDQARVLVQLVEEDGTHLHQEGVRVSYAYMFGGGGSGGGSESTDARGRADVTPLLPSTGELRKEGLRIIFTLDGEGLLDASPWKSNANFSIPGPELADRIAAAAGGEVILTVPARRHLRVPLLTVDVDGNPVAGVKLICSPAKKFEESELVTDGNGQAVVRPRFEMNRMGFDESILAQLPWVGGVGEDIRRSEPRFVTRDGKKILVITVQRAREVAIRIVDQDGKPLRGVKVSDNPFYGGTSILTDGNGAGRLSVVEGKAELYSELSGYRGGRFEVPPGVIEVTHRLTRLRVVSIVAHVPKDLAAEESLHAVNSRGGYWTLERGEDGAFRGEAEVPVETGAEFTVISPDRRFEGRANVGPLESSIELTLTPRKLLPVTLKFVDEDGNPIPDFRGTFRDHLTSPDILTFLPEEFRTDANGLLQVNLPAGRMSISVVAKGWRLEGIKQEFQVPAEEAVVLEFRK